MVNVDLAISLANVSKSYRIRTERNQSLKTAFIRRRRDVGQSFLALDDISFDVAKGSTFGIIGSNGAGKSTALKVLAGILEPDRGSVVVQGRVTALLELGAGFHGELSGRDNVYLNASILGIPRKVIQAKMDEIVAFSELDAFIDNPVKTYSSGMFARLAFSVMINVDPDVLLIDEVLAVGDESFQRRCVQKIEDLRTAGRTVVIVSHGLGQVQSMCDSVAWIHHGRLQMFGTPEVVIAAYLDQLESGPRSIDEHGRIHHGTGAVMIGSVELHAVRSEVDHVELGEECEFRIGLQCDSGMAARVELEIRRLDGVVVSGSSTDLSAVELKATTAQVRYVVPSMRLVPGTYEVGVWVVDAQGVQLDHVPHAARVTVGVRRGETPGVGVVDLGGTWAC